MRPETTYLFLQGPASPLFRMMANQLEAAGRSCLRINLHAGDALFWRRKGGFSYRKPIRNWGEFIRNFMVAKRVDAIILFGDERPYHVEAIRAAHEFGIAVYVIEMGYLRPDWVTIERDGVASNSHVPSNPDIITQVAASIPEPDWAAQFRQTFMAEALIDLAYYLPSVFLWFLYPGYRRHGLYHPLAEYAGWIGRLLNERSRHEKARSETQKIKSAGAPWFVYPLQLQTDYQLRAHSPYNSQQEAISEVIASFAKHAKSNAQLLIKVHPLDNGLVSWRKVIDRLKFQFAVSNRIHFLDGGNLADMIDGCSGVVTVNSTAALHSLRLKIPAKVLGVAIYDIKGMTDQQPLDAFWQKPKCPELGLTDSFYRLIASSIQVRGNLSSRTGAEAAASAIVERLLKGSVNHPGADFPEVPRLKPTKKRPNSSTA